MKYHLEQHTKMWGWGMLSVWRSVSVFKPVSTSFCDLQAALGRGMVSRFADFWMLQVTWWDELLEWHHLRILDFICEKNGGWLFSHRKNSSGLCVFFFFFLTYFIWMKCCWTAPVGCVSTCAHRCLSLGGRRLSVLCCRLGSSLRCLPACKLWYHAGSFLKAVKIYFFSW